MQATQRGIKTSYRVEDSAKVRPPAWAPSDGSLGVVAIDLTHVHRRQASSHFTPHDARPMLPMLVHRYIATLCVVGWHDVERLIHPTAGVGPRLVQKSRPTSGAHEA